MLSLPEHSTTALPVAQQNVGSFSCVRCLRYGEGGGHVVVSAGGSTIESRWLRDVTGVPCTTPSPRGRLELQTGAVISLAVCGLPAGRTALGVAGTTQGSLAIFLLDGTLMTLVGERALSGETAGGIRSEDVIRDVAIGFDPAGRPEFVVAATDRWVVLVDVLDLIKGGMEKDGALAAAAAVGWGWPCTFRRERSTPVCVSFAGTLRGGPVGAAAALAGDELGEIVRVLVPTRGSAAFAVDVAVVIVLADGTVRYLARHLREEGGAGVQVLLATHEALQRGPGTSPAVLAGEGQCEAAGHTTGLRGGGADDDDAGLLAASPWTGHGVPHVRYEYALAPESFSVCQCLPSGGDSSATSMPADLSITLNDSALVWNAQTGRMDLVVVGCQHSLIGPRMRVGWWAIARDVVRPRWTLKTLAEDQLRPRSALASPPGLTIHVCAGITAEIGTAPEGGTSECASSAVVGSPTAGGTFSRFPRPGASTLDALAKVVVLPSAVEDATAVFLARGYVLFAPGLIASGTMKGEGSTATLPGLLPLSRHTAVVEDAAVVEGGANHPARLLCAAGSTLTLLSV